MRLCPNLIVFHGDRQQQKYRAVQQHYVLERGLGTQNSGTKIRVWVGLGLCLTSMGIFRLGTHKVQNFGFFWVLPLGTQEYWVPKI